MSLDLSRLNPSQREAVLHGDGPLLVLAGAGSGKTSTMTHRIAHLVAVRRLPATAVLGLSFTNKAASELKDRVAKLVTRAAGATAAKGLIVTTFHSLCVRLLRAHAASVGYRPDFTIADESDRRDVLRQLLRNIRIDERRFDPDVLLFEIGQAKNRFLPPDQAEDYFYGSGRLSQDYAAVAVSVYPRYQEQLRLLNAMDFDDMLFQGVRLLETDAHARDTYNGRFRHILVDEYQDTNPAQFRLLSLLTRRSSNLCVVGDDDQSIYAWRGADPAHILEFTRHFPGARTVTLDQNYRSTSTILDAANGVIKSNRNRHPKTLWSDRGQGEPILEFVLEDDRDESDFVAEEIAKRGEARPWKDFAILYRSNAQSRTFEEALRRNRVPYKIVGGYSFLDRKEVKDVLAYWRLVVNPADDTSLRRVINWPSRKIGKSSIEVFCNHSFANGISLFDALSHAQELAPRAAAGSASLRALIEGLRAGLEATKAEPVAVADWARRSLDAIGARKAIGEETDDPVQAQLRQENIEELVHSLGQFRPEEAECGSAVLLEFLNRMMLDARDEDEDDEKADRDEVTLLTLHGSKGLEFPVVFLVGMEEGYLPHKRTIEEASDFGEERRLCYVGITRAKDQLMITRAKNRVRYGKPVPRYPSRFMAEVPQELVISTDRSSNPEFKDKKAKEEHEGRVKSFLDQMKSGLLKPSV